MTLATPEAGKAPTMMSDWVKALYCCWSNASADWRAVVSVAKSVWSVDTEFCKALSADCLAAGGHWYFHFNGSDEFWFTDSEGTKQVTFPSGFVHASYGMIMANVNTSYPMGYDTEVEGIEGEFYAVIKFTVSAGSFGENYEMIDVLEWIEKPWEAAAAE